MSTVKNLRFDPLGPVPRVAISFKELSKYNGAGLVLIPLHRYDDISVLPNGKVRLDGKRPIHNNWNDRIFPRCERVISICSKHGRNVGVRLDEYTLVIDVDERNDGLESIERLNSAIPLGLHLAPCTKTGNKGFHYYFRLNEPIDNVKTLADYPGIEFLTKGAQVVAAGSRHPQTKKLYRLCDEHPPLTERPLASQALIALITKVQASRIADNRECLGAFTSDDVGIALSHLDPDNFSTNDAWLPIMFAAHHASGGDAIEEFIDWSLNGAGFSDHEHLIRSRWESISSTPPARSYTYRTINYCLRKAGNAHAQLRISQPDTGEHLQLNDVNEGNIDLVFKLVNVSGKTKVFYWGKSAIDPSVRVPEFWSEEDLRRALRNRTVIVENKSVKLATWWLADPARRIYDGLTLSDADSPSDNDRINIWRGFSIQASDNGSWSLLKKHIKYNVASGDSASFEYILKWLAWSVQNPTAPAEVALVLYSEGKGTGKGFVGRTMVKLFGCHGLHIQRREHLVGKFNTHLSMCCLLFADEVLWPGYKEDEGVLQTLITEPTHMVEPKGVNAYPSPNCLKLILASNNAWVVPASGDERRYAVFEVSDRRKQNHSYFANIQAQMDNGGYEAMLAELLAFDLRDWHPRMDIPQTKALMDQKTRSASPEMKWIAGLLEEGCLPFSHQLHPERVAASPFYQHARKSNPGLSRWTDVEFAKYLATLGVTQKISNGSWRVFPSLHQMRADWQAKYPWWPPFNQVSQSWVAAPRRDDYSFD